MLRYIGLFAVAYIAIELLCATTLYLLEFDRPASLALATTILAVYLPSYFFNRAHRREPDKAERRLFAGGCVLFIYAFTAILFSLYLYLSGDGANISPFTAKEWRVTIMVLLLITLMYYWIIGSIFSWAVRNMRLKKIT